MNSWDDWAFLLGFAFIGGCEVAALVSSRRGDTLSEHVWALFGLRLGRDPERKTPTAWTKVRRVVVLGFLAWLVVHFASGGWV